MELIWDRKNWGLKIGQRNNQNNDKNEKEIKNWQKNYRGNIQRKQLTNYNNKILLDEEKFWSRGGEVALIAAENLLKEVEKDEISEDISERLLESKVQIVNLLNNEKKWGKELCVTVINVILKEAEENVFDISFRRFLVLVLGTTFATKRIDSLINVDLALEPDETFLKHIIRFLTLCFQLLPSMAYDIFYSRVQNLNFLVKSPSFIIEISSETLSDLEELKVIANCCLSKYDVKDVTLSDYLQPPENYREMTIFPTKLDLLINETKDIFLRENKSCGAYNSVAHYLDVQFRLMREDFIRPLREGIKDYKSNIKSFNIRVYRNVRIIDTAPDRKLGILHNVQLDLSRLTNINWSESKRFISGSLLCLSYDNLSTFSLAVVGKRSEKDLKEGILTIKFIHESPPDYREYIILESTNHFESYRHGLTRLQEIEEETFSMKKYIVNGNKNIDMPLYLRSNMDIAYTYKESFIRPGKDEVWPEAKYVEMNESQYSAFKMALTKELVLIQGPPGTGKTYLGLSICQCLLENIKLTLPDFPPILVVCYTNHALDQFLQGISEFTNKIIRIGGGCKSEKIISFSISDLKKRSYYSSVRNFELNEEMKDLEVEFNFRKNAFKSLISLERLQNVIPEEHYNYFISLRVEIWLKGESINVQEESISFHVLKMYNDIIKKEINKQLKEIFVELASEPNRTSVNLFEDDEFYNDPIRFSLYGFDTIKDKLSGNLFKNFLKKQSRMSPKEANDVKSLDELRLGDRWRLFRYWRGLYVSFIKDSTREMEEKYEKLCKDLNEILMKEDEEMMKEQDIIGMTTTGAAKHGKILEQIGCKIIIVEEAAEVMESHVIASLNPKCEHLILIGDHKQLRPSAAVYELGKHYSLDVSLFERLINNELDHTTLSIQHRMRPEISEIMRFIYDDFKDDESVLHYPNVPAIRSNIFFFNHFEPEEFREDILSYSNNFEAEYILKFCNHLLENGIDERSITILTLYSGQRFLINSLKDTICQNVQVSVVDNYQGEENDIILLSLVRSNEYQQIGFLNIENRICVSLSRAKQGLYVFGNFEILSNRNPMWKQIAKFLKDKNLLGNTMNMFCQNHPKKELFMNVPSDFDKYPDYGCDIMCKSMLSCGHICPRYCHFKDQRHIEHKCMEDCDNTCPYNHPCKKRCYETCGPCMVQVDKIIPTCNHTTAIACYKVPESSDCDIPCEKILPCHHKCTSTCGSKCSPCKVMVQRVFPKCGHSSQSFCCYISMKCPSFYEYEMMSLYKLKDFCNLCHSKGTLRK